MTIKRKTSFDAAEKAAKKQKTNRRVSKKIDLDEMCHIHKDGELLIKKGDEVYFERLKESKPILCVGKIISVEPNKRTGGQSVNIWDETHEECYGFDFPKDIELVKVRMFEDLTIAVAPKTPEPAPVVAPSEFAQGIVEGMREAAKAEVQGQLDAGRAVHGYQNGELVEISNVDDEGTELIIDAEPEDAP